jgi:hypothetical protein
MPLHLNVSTVALTVFLLMTSGCSSKESSSAFRFRLPPHPNVSAKSANLTASAAQPGFCYLVNVTASDLATKSKACYPNSGVSTPFTPPLGEVVLEVKRGDSRRIELFGYLLKSNETCASIGGSFHDVDANRIYAMGVVNNVQFDKPEVHVELTATFPGLNRPYPTALGLANCGAPPVGGGAPAVSQGGRLKGVRYTVDGAVSSGSDSVIQTGARFKVSSEVKHVSH